MEIQRRLRSFILDFRKHLRGLPDEDPKYGVPPEARANSDEIGVEMMDDDISSVTAS